jgi:hypothetical protein
VIYGTTPRRPYALILLSSFLLILVTGSCRPRVRTIAGDVFIVTRSAQNFKLGLVEVRVLLRDHLERSISESRTVATAELKKIEPRMIAARQTLAAVEPKYRKLEEERKTAERRVRDNFGVTSLQASIAVGERLAAVRREYEPARDRLAALEEEARYWNSSAFFFSRLPPPVKVAKTDADGKFLIVGIPNAPVGLAAHAIRQVGETQEDYYWLVIVSAESAPDERIFLSNDNLVSSGSANSLLHTPE